MLLSPNFNNLTSEGYAAFILAIVFTIVMLASFFFFAKHKQLNKIMLIVVTFVLPFLTTFCWIYLILNVLQYNTLVNLGISVAAAIGYVLIALLITLTFNYTDKEKDENVEVKEESESAPMLIEHNPQSEEEVVEDEKEVSEESEEKVEGVVFSTEEKKTFAEQLEALSYETHKAYEEILAYAQEQAGTKTKDAKYHVTVSVGRMRLVQFKFNRGALVSSFMAGSSELKNYSASEKNVKIKEKPVIVEIENEDSVPVAKNMVDIVYKNITDAKEDLKESKKAARKAKKQAEAEAEAVEVVEAPEEAPKKRGRRKKSEEVAEQPAETEEKPKRRGRRKKSEETEVE